MRPVTQILCGRFTDAPAAIVSSVDHVRLFHCPSMDAHAAFSHNDINSVTLLKAGRLGLSGQRFGLSLLGADRVSPIRRAKQEIAPLPGDAYFNSSLETCLW